MSEMEVYGSWAYASYDHSVSFPVQLPLFKLNPYYISIFNRNDYWLSTIHSSSQFCNVYGIGTPSYSKAGSYSYGVRPRFLFG